MRQPLTAVFASVIVALSPAAAFSDETTSAASATESVAQPSSGLRDNSAAGEPRPEALIEHAPVTVSVVDLAEGHDLTVSTSSLWERIRFGFAMTDCQSPLVAEHLADYLNTPESTTRMLDRSRRYLYHVVKEVEKRGLPTEIALLPMIESAYNPTALSSARASGIWQFIPSTGRIYGLDQNDWYDERRDVLQATQAALDYLEKLYEMFGSWDLALAAYNAGEGTVSRAIARNEAAGLPTDYVNLPLPAETRNYVPKLQAVKQLVASPQRYGIEIIDIPNQPYFSTVATRRQMDAETAARLAGIPLSEFLKLNPAYNRPVLMPEDSRPVLVPAEKVDQFATNLLRNEGPLVTWQTYRVKRKERIDRVASRFGMSTGRLAEVNGLSVGSRLSPGQTLLVQAPGPAARRVDEVDAATLASLGPTPDETKTVARRPAGKSLKVVAKGRRDAPKATPARQTPSVKVAKPAPTNRASRSREAKSAPASHKTHVAGAER
jgi:membrane-bound lytic murein transglycosylase D